MITSIPAAAGETPLQVPDERPPKIARDIEHATEITPMPGTEIFPLPEADIHTDTRTAMSNSGDIYVDGGGYLWKSTDRGETVSGQGYF